jgi:hypothetical protein
MSELEPVDPQEAAEQLFKPELKYSEIGHVDTGLDRECKPVRAAAKQIPAAADVEVLDDDEDCETAEDIELELAELEEEEAEPAPAASVRKPFKIKPGEKMYFITGGQLVTMVVALPLMSAAISMGSMYLGHVITERTMRPSNFALAPAPKFEMPKFEIKMPPMPVAAAPIVQVNPTPVQINVPAMAAAPNPVARLSTIGSVQSARATPVAAVSKTVESYNAEVVPDSALDEVIPASAVSSERDNSRSSPSPVPADAKVTPVPATAPAVRAASPAPGRSSSYLAPLDDAPYLVDVTARDAAAGVLPPAPAPELLATRAVEVEMPAATFEAPEWLEKEVHAEVLTPPSQVEPAAKAKPVMTEVVVTTPEKATMPAVDPADETMQGEILPRSAAEIAREKSDEYRRGH